MHLEQLARRFRTFDRWQGATPIGSGNINDTFKIELEIGHRQEQWLLQRLNHHVFQQPEAVMANIQLHHHLTHFLKQTNLSHSILLYFLH